MQKCVFERGFCSARPTDSDESTALPSSITGFLLMEEIVNVFLDCLHRILGFYLFVVIGGTNKIQVVK